MVGAFFVDLCHKIQDDFDYQYKGKLGGYIMKNAVKEYIELTDLEKKKLWDSATFVFDTNVFLNLYRYSRKTREALLDSMKDLKGRIWMPYQVAYEFMKDRPEVIFDSVNRYLQLEESILRPCKEKLRIKDDDPDFKKLQEYVGKWIEDYKKTNLLIDDVSKDTVLSDILKLFDGKTGKPFSEDDLKTIKTEGVERYKNEIPPGYKDKKKVTVDSDNNAYGDLIVWKQILDFAKENKKDIIFVTSDQKEDWWNIIHGKTLGPRVELKKEFYDCAGTKFHMYSMDGFISNVESVKGNSSIVDEVKAYNSVPFGMFTMVRDFGEYTDNLNESIQFMDLLQLQGLIRDIERKKTRRMRELDAIMQKYEGKEMPEPTQTLVHNLRKNIRADRDKLAFLNHRRNEFAHKDYSERA